MPDFNQQPTDPSNPFDPRPRRQPSEDDGHVGNDAQSEPLTDTATPEVAEQTQADKTDPSQRIAELQAQIAGLEDENLRAQAEVQNTRRRANEEMAKARKYAIAGFAENLLSVLDSLEAALNVKNASAEQLREGTVATHKQLLGALERNAVVEINPAAGDKFDPTRQHAISMVETDAQPAGTVVTVMQKGYMLAERVLRPALVTVAQGK